MPQSNWSSYPWPGLPGAHEYPKSNGLEDWRKGSALRADTREGTHFPPSLTLLCMCTHAHEFLKHRNILTWQFNSINRVETYSDLGIEK